jgi:hypothetical protein
VRETNDNHNSSEAGSLYLFWVAPRLRTASPAEADGSLFREGPVPLVDMEVSYREAGAVLSFVTRRVT